MDDAVRTNGSDTRDSIVLLTGLLIGALAGLGAMILLAPRSGKRTRVRIEQESMKLQGWVTDTFDDLVSLLHFDDRKILTRTQG